MEDREFLGNQMVQRQQKRKNSREPEVCKFLVNIRMFYNRHSTVFRYDTRSAASSTLKASVVEGNFVGTVNPNANFLAQIPPAKLKKLKADSTTYAFVIYFVLV